VNLSDLQELIDRGDYQSNSYDWLRGGIVYDIHTGEISSGSSDNQLDRLFDDNRELTKKNKELHNSLHNITRKYEKSVGAYNKLVEDLSKLKNGNLNLIRSNRRQENGYGWLILVMAVIYGIFADDRLRVLTTTTLLILVSTLMFFVTYWVVEQIRARYYKNSNSDVSERLLGIAVSIAAALFALITVTLFSGNFPPLSSWFAELGIAYLFERFFNHRLNQDISIPTPAITTQSRTDTIAISECDYFVQESGYNSKHRIAFSLMSVSTGIMLLYYSLPFLMPEWLIILLGIIILIIFGAFLQIHFKIARNVKIPVTIRESLDFLRYHWTAIKPAWNSEPRIFLIFYLTTIFAIMCCLLSILLPFEDELCQILC